MNVAFGLRLKLNHAVSGANLHSHPINYRHLGSSGQQQVTGSAGSDDNDFWIIVPRHGQPMTFSPSPVSDGDVIRLQHQLTGRNLHSHAGFPSPITGQQEVTCFGQNGMGDANDNWKVEVPGGGTWSEGARVRLVHVPTDVVLHSHGGFTDPALTAGQQEVTGYPGRDDNDFWEAVTVGSPGVRTVTATVRSSLGANHWMETGATLAESGALDAVTTTWTGTWLGGFTGGVTLVGLDSANVAIAATDNHSYGVSGTLIGQSRRVDRWRYDFGSATASKLTSLLVVHYWAPKVSWQQIVQAVKDAIKIAIDLLNNASDLKTTLSDVGNRAGGIVRIGVGPYSPPGA